ncbi:MAG TPA: hypothetical protein VGH19_10405 [Verrucomicrobiae bacterium]
MDINGAELLKERKGSVKFILNDSGILFFPATQQHRDMKGMGLSYEDDYRGNAVAGLVMERRVEIRFHKAFADERIKRLWARVMANAEIAKAGLGKLYYQGREI